MLARILFVVSYSVSLVHGAVSLAGGGGFG